MTILGAAEFEYRGLRCIEVVNVQVDVHLLRNRLARPLWRHVGVNPLKSQGVAVLGADRTPISLVLVDLPAEQLAVEVGQCSWVGAIKNDHWEPSDSHSEQGRAL
jgi:hypothetical protein